MSEMELPMNDQAAEMESSDLTCFVGGKPTEAATAKQPHRVAALPDVLCKRYKIERLLGVGGMGAVYRARDLLREQYGDPDPYVALKTLNEEFAEYPDANALLIANSH